MGYGQRSWISLLRLVKTVHNGDSYTAPRALLILEAQAILASFLRDSVTKLLGADGLTVEETSEKLTLLAVDSRVPSQYQESSWLQFGMNYYNVGDLRNFILMQYPSEDLYLLMRLC